MRRVVLRRRVYFIPVAVHSELRHGADSHFEPDGIHSAAQTNFHNDRVLLVDRNGGHTGLCGSTGLSEIVGTFGRILFCVVGGVPVVERGERRRSRLQTLCDRRRIDRRTDNLHRRAHFDDARRRSVVESSIGDGGAALHSGRHHEGDRGGMVGRQTQ